MLILESTDKRPFSSSKRPCFRLSYRPTSVLLIEASVFRIGARVNPLSYRPASVLVRDASMTGARTPPRSYRPASFLLLEESVFQTCRSCYSSKLSTSVRSPHRSVHISEWRSCSSSKQSFLGTTRRVPQCFRARPRTFFRDLLQVKVEEQKNQTDGHRTTGQCPLVLFLEAIDQRPFSSSK